MRRSSRRSPARGALHRRAFAVAVMLGIGTWLSACGGGGSDAGAPGAGDSPIGSGNGALRVLLTDSPACGFDNLFVTVERVRVHQDAGAADSATGCREITLDPPHRIDLLTLGNGVLTDLGRTALPTGHYTQLRLVLAENSSVNPPANAVKPTGAPETPLSTPIAQQSGLKLPVAIDVAANRQADFVIDFDACDSIVHAGNAGNFILKPVLRGLSLMTSGVQGRIDAALVGPQTLVSLQRAGRIVKSTMPDRSGAFVLSPVVPGNYRLVVSAPGRATVVVIGVPVMESTLLPLSGQALGAPASPTAVLSGTVSTGSMPVVATVHALQALNDGSTVQVAGQPVAGTGGGYSLVVPTAAPLVAHYVPSGALVFGAHTSAVARHTVAPVPVQRGTRLRDVQGLYAASGSGPATRPRPTALATICCLLDSPNLRFALSRW